MISKAFESEIDYLQIMDENGNVDQQMFPKDLSNNIIAEMYKKMVLARAFDAKMLSLQRQGRAVTYAPLLGEEATQIGSAFAMRAQDMFVPSFRQHGVYITRGMPMDKMILYWRGYEEGDMVPKGVNGFLTIVPVATQLPHAVGIAFAQKYKKNDAAVIAYVGDGGTSEGDFYESLNFAGAWKAPIVVIIENNQWAISMPRSKQTAAKTLAQKADAAGIDSIQVDGNDAVAVYKATKDAIAKANSGPTLIECITYRMGLHTTADDPTKYRTDDEVEYWKKRDPILRIRIYLTKNGLWNDKMENDLNDQNLKLIDAAVEKAESFKPDPKSMFQNVYSSMPDALKEEMDEAEKANYWQV